MRGLFGTMKGRTQQHVPFSAEEKKKLCVQYRSLLLDGIAPFWLERGVDREYGGVLSCMSEDGKVQSGDKFIWSQARSVWTFSALYNRIDPQPEFLDAARNSVCFLLAHGRDDRGRWVYHTDREGRVLEGTTSIYADCFAIYGLSEYYRATRDEQALSVARQSFDRVVRRIEEPDFNETMPYPMPPEWKNHGIPMIMTEVAHELAQTLGDDRVERLAIQYANRVMQHFVKPERKVLLEYLTRDYRELPPPAGTFVMPGHAIESMGFVLHVARHHRNQDLIRRAVEVIRWHLELSWDEECGGMVLSRDIAGGEPFLPHSQKTGAAAASEAAEILRGALAGPGSARIIVGTGNSQLEMVAALVVEPGLEWRRVEVFHMDEYIGMSEEHPASFQRWLKANLVDIVHPGKVHYLNGTAADLARECERYAALLHAGPIDICFLGFGENGHIAFNDPGVADFHGPLAVKQVTMDERCRHQQVGEGHFPSIDAMPREAVTLTCPELLRARHLICTVPDLRKAEAVKNALTGPIAESCPSSIVRTHPGAAIFFDADSASLLPPSVSVRFFLQPRTCL